MHRTLACSSAGALDRWQGPTDFLTFESSCFSSPVFPFQLLEILLDSWLILSFFWLIKQRVSKEVLHRKRPLMANSLWCATSSAGWVGGKKEKQYFVPCSTDPLRAVSKSGIQSLGLNFYNPNFYGKKYLVNGGF